MDEFRAASLQSWSTVAPDWAELIAGVDRQLEAAAKWMIDAVELRPGERVLELAGGPGTVSMIAARAVAPDGHVTCTDFAEPMVAAARRRIAEHGLSNVDCRTLDAEAVDLPDGAIDVVLCRMGYMLMADPAGALRETARVLAPGGRLALAVWSDPTSNPWASVPMRAIMGQIGGSPPPPGTPGLWALADEDHLRGLLEAAGVGSIRVERLDAVVEFDSAHQWLATTSRLAGPIRTLLASLDDSARAAIEAHVEQAADAYGTADGRLAVPQRMVVASARRG